MVRRLVVAALARSARHAIMPLLRAFVDPAQGERSSGYCFRRRSVGRRLVAEALGGLSFVRSLSSLGVQHLEIPRRHHVEVDLVVAP